MSVTFLTNEDEQNFVKSVNDQKPDENGNVKITIPESSGGTVKTVNGVSPDENGNVKITIPEGDVGDDGRYYTPAVNQIDGTTVEFTFAPSKEDMPSINPVQVTLPVSENSGGNVDLTEQVKRAETAATAAENAATRAEEAAANAESVDLTEQVERAETAASNAENSSNTASSAADAAADEASAAAECAIIAQNHAADAASSAAEAKEIVDELPTTIETKLTEAKESGEFDGQPGKDGTSVTHSWNGTTLTVTSASGTSSADLKGETGNDGYTPVKGVDYYTEAEQAEWEAYIATELAKRGQIKPEYANSIEECSDTTKLYVLPDGYIYAYMNKSGYSDTDIMPVGTTTQTKNELTTTPDGNGGYILNGTPTTNTVYKIYENTSVLPGGFEPGGKYKIKVLSGYVGSASILYHNGSEWISLNTVIRPDKLTEEFTLPSDAVGLQIKYYAAANHTFTNELVKIACYEWQEGEGFVSTNLPFVPADYEDRIQALESAVRDLGSSAGASPKPMLTIVDDDGYKKFKTLLLPIVQSKKVPIASSVIVSYANGENEAAAGKVMTWEEIQECAIYGAEIISHSYSHLTHIKAEEMTKQEIQHDYQRAKNTLMRYGIYSKGLVYCGDSYALDVCREACENVYEYGINPGTNKTNYKGSVDPYNINRYGISSDTMTEEDLKALIDTLVTGGTGWMIWTIHTSDGTFQQTQADIISTVIDYAIEQGVEIVTTECGVRHYL